MKKYTLWIFSFFMLILSFLLVGMNQVKASDIEYETYILKWDEITTSDSSADHLGKSYVLNIEKNIQSIGYVTYEIYVKNIGTERLNYNYGTYQIMGGVASEYKIRFEDDLSVNGTTTFVIRNYDIDTVEEFASSLVNRNFYQSMTNSLNQLLGSNLEFSYLDTGTSRPVNGYDDVYNNQTLGYSYIDMNGHEYKGTYSMNTLESFGTTANVNTEIKNVSVTRLSDFYTVEDLEIKYQEGYVKGKNDGYQEGYDIGYQEGKESVIDPDYNEAYQEGFLAGYENGKNDGIQEGISSVDTDQIRQEAYQNGFNEGKASVDITSDNENIWNEAYQEGMDDGLVIGYQNGKDSVDISQVEQEAYDRGFNNGYNTGFAEGESSVDITSDNDSAIDLYITQNKLYTEFEFNLSFNSGYNTGKSDGIKYVYENIENDETITKYIKDYIYVNKYHTNTEYINNSDNAYQNGFKSGYNSGFTDGKEVIYQNISSDPVIKEYYKEKIINGTVIKFVNEGNEVINIVKNYDVTENSDDDLIISIHNGQDTYKIETVEEVIPGQSITNTIIDYGFAAKLLSMCGAVLLGVIIIFLIALFFTSISSPSKKIGAKRKVRDGYVWSN